MSALLRDSALGQVIRLATRNKVLLYPEEKPGFQCPNCYSDPAHQQQAKPLSDPQTPIESLANEEKPPLQAPKPAEEPVEKPAVDMVPVHRAESIEESSPAPTEKDFDLAPVTTARTGLSRVDTRVTMEKIQTRRELEEAYTTATLEKGPTAPIIPEKLDDGTILVDWYDTDDPDNPQNWSFGKKSFVTFQIW